MYIILKIWGINRTITYIILKIWGIKCHLAANAVVLVLGEYQISIAKYLGGGGGYLHINKI